MSLKRKFIKKSHAQEILGDETNDFLCDIDEGESDGEGSVFSEESDLREEEFGDGSDDTGDDKRSGDGGDDGQDSDDEWEDTDDSEDEGDDPFASFFEKAALDDDDESGIRNGQMSSSGKMSVSNLSEAESVDSGIGKSIASLGTEGGTSVAEDDKNTDAGKTSDGAVDGEAKANEDRHTEDAPYDEYAEGDTSDEEDIRNAAGNVPESWYRGYTHIGYDLDGHKIPAPKKLNAIDKHLLRMENPDYERMIPHPVTGQMVVLSDKDVDMLERIASGRAPDPDYDEYQPFLDLYSHEVLQMPVRGTKTTKESFIPNTNEMRKVRRLATALLKGSMRASAKPRRLPLVDIWRGSRRSEETENKYVKRHIPPPKLSLPGHGLSYRPPPEYTMGVVKMKRTKEEKTLEAEMDKDVDEMKDEGQEEEKEHKLVQSGRRYDSIRHIPPCRDILKERVFRLRDLYQGTRRRTSRMYGRANKLVPDLPKPEDMRPFPTTSEITYKGHRNIIRCISIHPEGRYLASGSDDCTIRIWEIFTGRCLRVISTEHEVTWVQWNPNPKLFLLAFTMENKMILVCPETYLTDKLVINQTNAVLRQPPEQGDVIPSKSVTSKVQWKLANKHQYQKGYRLILEHSSLVRRVEWHRQGDYFLTVGFRSSIGEVLLHQLSHWRSVHPFKRSNHGLIQLAAFHPRRPYLFVATQRRVLVYDLREHKLYKKILVPTKWLSSLAFHPNGEHFLVGTFDKKVIWFEMESTKRPHLLRYHKEAVRMVAMHRKYPLFASASDSGQTIVAHAMVYNDLLADPTIVPLRILKGHCMVDGYCVLDVKWHPYEPYLFTAGSDGYIKLWH